jgi:hypothetical protein
MLRTSIDATAARQAHCSTCSRQQPAVLQLMRVPLQTKRLLQQLALCAELQQATMSICVTQHAHVLVQMSGQTHDAVNKATQQLPLCFTQLAVSAALADCWQLPLPKDKPGIGRCTGAAAAWVPASLACTELPQRRLYEAGGISSMHQRRASALPGGVSAATVLLARSTLYVMLMGRQSWQVAVLSCACHDSQVAMQQRCGAA